MTYQDCLDYLYQRLPMYQRTGKAALKPNLDNTKALLKALDNPEKSFKSVHVAGTNGKGSSSHALAAIIQSAGLKTGLYTSPHLLSFTERIRINGVEISQEAVISFVEKMKPVIEQIMPSFFEVTVALAFDYFSQQNVDIAIVEVGLGGRLDSTNVIIPEVSLITSIGLDHTDLLGDTLAKIASEKAGIIKQAVPVVIGKYQEETWPVFSEIAADKQSEIILAEQPVTVLESTEDHDIINYDNEAYEVDLIAEYYLKNLPGVFEVIKVLRQKKFNIDGQAIKSGLKNMKKLTGLKGRFQVLSKQPLVIADISHNEPGMQALIQQVLTVKKGKLHIIYGTVKDKSITEIIRLFPETAHLYFTQSQIPRSLLSEELQAIAATMGYQGPVFQNVNEALVEAEKNAAPNDLILITGSTFVIAEINGL